MSVTSWVVRLGKPGPQLHAWLCNGHAAVTVPIAAKPSSANISIDLKYVPGIWSNKEKEWETKPSRKCLVFPKYWFEWVEPCLEGETSIFWLTFTTECVALSLSGYRTNPSSLCVLVGIWWPFYWCFALAPSQCKATVEHAMVQETRLSFVGLDVFTLLLPKEGPWQPLLSGCQKN